MVGKYCSFKNTEDDYTLPVKRLIGGIRHKEPPHIPQLSLPTSVPNDCCDRGLITKSHFIQATGDLIFEPFIISFSAEITPEPDTYANTMVPSNNPCAQSNSRLAMWFSKKSAVNFHKTHDISNYIYWKDPCYKILLKRYIYNIINKEILLA